MSGFSLADHSHRRLNILTGEYVLVAPHRAKRPWQGKQETTEVDHKPAYDPTCYLCPGNPRAGGQTNPAYADVFIFDNDFSSLLPDVPPGDYNRDGLLVAQSETGLCRVVCFSPQHNLTLAEMDAPAITRVVEAWTTEFEAVGAKPDINYVQIFENKGQLMGCSNPHPHGQIWAQHTVPDEPAKETAHQLAYYQQQGRSLLADYLALELKEQARLVALNDHFVALVPFWAVWPYETLVISRRHVQDLTQLTAAEREGLAEVIHQVTVRYDNLFQTSFPYSAGLHQRPTDGQAHEGWHLHMHFYPPLLRNATVKKFMVGYELLAGPQRDITPEYSAEVLRGLSGVHYKYS